MRRALFALAVGGLLAAAIPLLPDCRAADPAPLPDLQGIAIDFSWSGYTVELVQANLPYMQPLTVTVYLRNAGPGRSVGANLSLFTDGRLLAIIPVGAELNSTGPGSETWTVYLWDIWALPPGWHLFRARADDPAGDMNGSDNSVEKSLHFMDRRPELNITLSPQTILADVLAAKAATVEFAGQVRAESLDGIAPSVTLSSSTDIGWPSSILYGPEFGTGADVMTFRAIVTVPPGTRTDNFGRLEVTGAIEVGGLYSSNETHATITVRPYFCATVECEKPLQVIGPEGKETFEFRIRNIGNSYDSYTIVISNRKELEGRGWTINLSHTQTRKVSPGADLPFRLVVTPPKTLSPYTDETVVFDLNVSSQNDSGSLVMYLATPIAKLQVRGYNTPGVMLLSASIIMLLAALLAAFFIHRRRRR